MSFRIRATLILSIGALALLWMPVSAQPRVVRHVIGSGATAAATPGGTMIMVGTIGQPIVGPAFSSMHIGHFGFWYAVPTGTTGIRPDFASTGMAPALNLWPNSASDRTEVHMQLPRGADVSLRLFDALGRQRLVLLDGPQQAGNSVLDLSVAHLESGSYMLVLVSGPSRVTAPLRVVR